MMKRVLTLLFVLFLFGAQAQSKRYYDWLDRTELDSVAIKEPSHELLNIVNFDREGLTGKLLFELNERRVKKGRPVWEINESFMQVCNVGVKHLSKNYFKKSRKYRSKVTRYTEFGLRHMNGSCRMFRAFTFYVNLTNLKTYSRFYFARKDNTSPLHLYAGKKPRITDPEHKDYEQPKPINPHTESIYVNSLIDLIKNASSVRELTLRRYSEIGIAMRLDEYSIDRRKIPHAFVMVIVGGKQLQDAKTKDVVKRNIDYDPFIVIE